MRVDVFNITIIIAISVWVNLSKPCVWFVGHPKILSRT